MRTGAGSQVFAQNADGSYDSSQLVLGDAAGVAFADWLGTQGAAGAGVFNANIDGDRAREFFAGLKANRDFNGADPEGLGFFHFSIGKGRRVGSAHAYLRRAERRPNLSVVTGAMASHLLFDGARCVGVALADGREMRAAREVILSAGAFHSPWLLLRSGIGPADELARHGIAPRVALGGVAHVTQLACASAA